MPRIWQEFYCNDCDTYIDVILNMAINRAVVVVCPGCGREHPRSIKDGVINDDCYSGDAEKIRPVKSACHKEPKMRAMQAQRWGQPRGGVTAEDPGGFLSEAWAERYGHRA